MTDTSVTAHETAAPSIDTAKIAVVVPIPNDPDWGIFREISEEIPIIVVDDSNGKLAPPPRANVQYFDYAAQEAAMGAHYAAQPHKSAATRNFGHWLAYKEGYDVIVALDYDCRPDPGWLEEHLACLGPVTDAPALQGAWINTIENEGLWARGYPYELRNPEAGAVQETTASGIVKINMGVWSNVLDLNGVDKLERGDVPTEPELREGANRIALGNVPICGMNTAFLSEITPAYFFLPDVWVNGWQLSRHDDIWGGYVLKKLMDLRGDLFAYGRPIVEHTRQSALERVVVIEHYMHLMSMQFYGIVDAAVERVRPGSYTEMFGAFAEEYRREADVAPGIPAHCRAALQELGDWMLRWAAAFA